MHANNWDILGNLLLAAFLGAVGQLIRIVAGLKKASDDASAKGKSLSEVFDGKRLLVSLGLSIAIGAIAGLLASFKITTNPWDKSVLLSLLSAGYAGSDFIEAFMKKASPANPPATTTQANPPAALPQGQSSQAQPSSQGASLPAASTRLRLNPNTTTNPKENPMPFALRPGQPGDNADWIGTTNTPFTISADSDDGLSALNSARYNNVPLSAPPFTYTIAEGIHPLVTNVVGATVGTTVHIREVAPDGTKQELASFPIGPADDGRTFISVKGVTV